MLHEFLKLEDGMIDLQHHRGYILVEGGMIDQAHHRGYARRALDEASAMSDAVQVAVDWVKASGRVDTLIVVTSDHTHSLAFNGYPTRGSDITGQFYQC
ncbi:unnamed protein product [Timema podura]|uniref:alkaline phosphatase n=1 Tax=Timema podura TaxID=61482 RepID=A0ABN7P952_TIMPD|nr:unnamed protein product [Timema podura]